MNRALKIHDKTLRSEGRAAAVTQNVFKKHILIENNFSWNGKRFFSEYRIVTMQTIMFTVK